MTDKENLLGMELGQLWLCAHVLLPEAARQYVTMANKATATQAHESAFNDTLYNGTYSANGALFRAWTELRDQFQDVMTLSAENLYEVCDVLDKVRESFGHVDGMNAQNVKAAAEATIDGYTQVPEQPGQDLDGDGKKGEHGGDFRDRTVVDPGNRPHVDDGSRDPLKGNPNYDTGGKNYYDTPGG